LATVYTADAATTPTSDISPTTSRGCGGLIVVVPDGVLDTEGATAAIFAIAGCGSGADGDGATAAILAATGFGSSATGFAGFAVFVDAVVEPGR
jgi:hypothetical protein